MENEELLEALRERMQMPAAKEFRNLRSQTVELNYADLKEQRGIRRFHCRQRRDQFDLFLRGRFDRQRQSLPRGRQQRRRYGRQHAGQPTSTAPNARMTPNRPPKLPRAKSLLPSRFPGK
jgi:hypothetical protein